MWPQLVTQLACDSLTSIVAMAVRDGAEPCCYGNVPVRELSGFVGSKRLRGMFVWHCFSSNVRVCVSACVCVSVSYCAMSQGCRDLCQRSRHTVRAASLLGLPRSTPLQPHLVLANHASFAMVTGQTVARVTSGCIRVAGIKLVDFASQR